jgi:hypothetical protein
MNTTIKLYQLNRGEMLTTEPGAARYDTTYRVGRPIVIHPFTILRKTSLVSM